MAQEANKMNVALLYLVMLQTILTKKFKLNSVAERDVILTFHGSDVLLFCQGNLNSEKSH